MEKSSKKYGLDFEVFRDEIRFNIIDLETQVIEKYSASKDLLKIRKLIRDCFYILDESDMYNKIIPKKVYFAHNAPFDKFVAYWIYQNMEEFSIELCSLFHSTYMLTNKIDYSNDRIYANIGIYESSPDIKLINPENNHGNKNIPKHSLKVYAPYVHLEHDHFNFSDKLYYYDLSEEDQEIFDSYENKDLQALYLIMKNVNYKSAGMPYLEMIEDVTNYVQTFYPYLLQKASFHHDLYKNASTAFSKYVLKKESDDQQIYLRLEHEILQKKLYEDLQLKRVSSPLDSFIENRRLLIVNYLKSIGVNNEEFVNTLFELGLLNDLESDIKKYYESHELGLRDFYNNVSTNEVLLTKYNIINDKNKKDFEIIKTSGLFKEIMKYDHDLFDNRYSNQELIDHCLSCIPKESSDLQVLDTYIQQKIGAKPIRFKKITKYIDSIISYHFLDCEYVKDYYGMDVLVGKGGVHSIHNQTEYYKTNEDYTIVDVDLVQSYPTEMVRMDELKCIYNNEIIADKIRERNEYKKDPEKSKFVKAIKFLTVSAFGSVQYFSSFSALHTGITLRDRITALCRHKLLKKLESICDKFKDVKLIQVNTDGLTLYIPNKIKEEFIDLILNDSINKWEYGEFDYILVKDVNNYIASDFEGKVKEKGAFSTKGKINSGNFYHPIIVDRLLYNLKLKDNIDYDLKHLKIFVNKLNRKDKDLSVCDWVYLKGLNLLGFAFNESFQHCVEYSTINELKESDIDILASLLVYELGIHQEIDREKSRNLIESNILKLKTQHNSTNVDYYLSIGKKNFVGRDFLASNYELFNKLKESYEDIEITCRGMYVLDFDFSVNPNNPIFNDDNFKTYTIYNSLSNRCKMFFLNDLISELSASKKIFKYLRSTFDFKDDEIIELLKPSKFVRINSKDYDIVKNDTQFLNITQLFNCGLSLKIPRVDSEVKKKKKAMTISSDC